MRFTQTLTLALTLACGAAFAADYGPYPVTFLKGDIEGIEQNAGGTADLTNPKTLTLKAHDTKFELPYSAIFGAERKDVVISVEKEPLYKVWTLPKRLGIVAPFPLQEVSFDYKDKAGTLHSMTVEMEPTAADRLFLRVKQAGEKKAATRGDWWGDSVWKTHRNQTTWDAEHQPDDSSVASTK
jgi:hypothetical protein